MVTLCALEGNIVKTNTVSVSMELSTLNHQDSHDNHQRFNTPVVLRT